MENMGKHQPNLSDFLEEAELQQYSDLFRDVLKITNLSQLKFVVNEDLEQIGLSRPEQRRYKKIFNKYFPNPYLNKIKKLLTSNKKPDSSSQTITSIPVDLQPFNDTNVKLPTKHIISIDDITINKELGKGQFGVVQQGTWTTGNQRLQVAIKCLGQERMSSNSAEFLKEAAVMHSIEHANIVRLYGVVLHSDSLMLVTETETVDEVTELAPLRSLLECVREVALRPEFIVPTLCNFAEQICDGMHYLEQKRLIHRDLAARNILVFSKDKVKISDFGLSRALGVGKDYYQTNYNVNLKLPVAWCAPECILFLRFTSASDVWAFGVCLWEMLTYGFQPWAGFSGQQILEAIDSPICQRLERPQCSTEEYYNIMLSCWSHEPNHRPRFSELGAILRNSRPELVQATVTFIKPKGGRNNHLLDYETGDIITILGKENVTHLPLWYGVAPCGACGLFDPRNTRPYFAVYRNVRTVSTLSPNPTRHSSRFRTSLLRSDVKRHTFTGKRSIQCNMISCPQGDVKHTGHVGLDGAYFGDLSFLDPNGLPPRQVVNPYKPLEDLEQVPLINPNSPSHLTGGASGSTPYPALTNKMEKAERDEANSKKGDKKNSRKGNQRSLSESTSLSRTILNKVKYSTLGRSHKSEVASAATSKTEDVHEYHEISDNDTSENTPVKSLSRAEALRASSSGDFSQSLIDEMESLFRSLDSARRREEAMAAMKPPDSAQAKSKPNKGKPKRSYWLFKFKPKEKVDDSNLVKSTDLEKYFRPQPAPKPEKKKASPSTMKPMTAYEEKTLDTAVAMANEITAKSMNDLEGEKPKPHSPNDRSKFHFKFPISLHHHGHHSNEHEKEKEHTSKHERRNFSDEANNFPDLQATLTEESKHAYTSLIEEPTPSTSLMTHLAKDPTAVLQPTIAKSNAQFSHRHFHSMPRNTNFQGQNRQIVQRSDEFLNYADNPLPLPPRTTKPKLIDKPRHIRKYPLKIIGEVKPLAEPIEPQPIIYQNTTSPLKREQKVAPLMPEVKDIDVLDGPDPSILATNPFTNEPGQSVPGPSTGDLVKPGPSGANPFTSYSFDEDDGVDADLNLDVEIYSDESENEADKAGALVKDCKDHVSVEDLLEFADKKPCGRQRGVESDEVRIMSKVFKQQVSPEECLEALELSDWNVHNAIKLVRVSVSVGADVTLEACSTELAKANGDITKASAVLESCKQKT